MRVTLKSKADKHVALISGWNWNSGSVGYCEGRKNGEPGEKPLEQGENQQQTIIITGETGITIYNYKSHRKLVNVKRLKKKNRLVCINLRPEYFPNIFVMNSRLDL